MAFETPQISLASMKLDELFYQDLAAFTEGFEITPVPIEQDLRAGAIGWIAAFAPEAVSERSRHCLKSACLAARIAPDYATKSWYRMPYLDVAQFLLTSDLLWLGTLISNLDHGSSQLRRSLHAPFGLAAHLMTLGNPELLSRIKSNFLKAHFFNDCLMCLFCVLKNSPTLKAAQLIRWRREVDLAPQDIAVVDALIAREYISNSDIFTKYDNITRYIVCRLLDFDLATKTCHRQSDMFDSQNTGFLTMNMLWQRLSQHPLMRASVSLEMMKI